MSIEKSDENPIFTSEKVKTPEVVDALQKAKKDPETAQGLETTKTNVLEATDDFVHIIKLLISSFSYGNNDVVEQINRQRTDLDKVKIIASELRKYPLTVDGKNISLITFIRNGGPDRGSIINTLPQEQQRIVALYLWLYQTGISEQQLTADNYSAIDWNTALIAYQNYTAKHYGESPVIEKTPTLSTEKQIAAINASLDNLPDSIDSLSLEQEDKIENILQQVTKLYFELPGYQRSNSLFQPIKAKHEVYLNYVLSKNPLNHTQALRALRIFPTPQSYAKLKDWFVQQPGTLSAKEHPNPSALEDTINNLPIHQLSVTELLSSYAQITQSLRDNETLNNRDTPAYEHEKNEQILPSQAARYNETFPELSSITDNEPTTWLGKLMDKNITKEFGNFVEENLKELSPISRVTPEKKVYTSSQELIAPFTQNVAGELIARYQSSIEGQDKQLFKEDLIKFADMLTDDKLDKSARNYDTAFSVLSQIALDQMGVQEKIETSINDTQWDALIEERFYGLPVKEILNSPDKAPSCIPQERVGLYNQLATQLGWNEFMKQEGGNKKMERGDQIAYLSMIQTTLNISDPTNLHGAIELFELNCSYNQHRLLTDVMSKTDLTEAMKKIDPNVLQRIDKLSGFVSGAPIDPTLSVAGVKGKAGGLLKRMLAAPFKFVGKKIRGSVKWTAGRILIGATIVVGIGALAYFGGKRVWKHLPNIKHEVVETPEPGPLTFSEIMADRTLSVSRVDTVHQVVAVRHIYNEIQAEPDDMGITKRMKKKFNERGDSEANVEFNGYLQATFDQKKVDSLMKINILPVKDPNFNDKYFFHIELPPTTLEVAFPADSTAFKIYETDSNVRINMGKLLESIFQVENGPAQKSENYVHQKLLSIAIQKYTENIEADQPKLEEILTHAQGELSQIIKDQIIWAYGLQHVTIDPSWIDIEFNDSYEIKTHPAAQSGPLKQIINENLKN